MHGRFRSTRDMAQPNKIHTLPKQPPHSIEAEQSVLGGLMLDNRAFYDLADRLHATDFYRADHQLIYRAIGELISASKPCDFVTLSEHLRNQGRLDEAGGIAYLGSLAVDTYSVSNLLHYADIVRERSVLRSLIAIGADLGEMGYRPEGRGTAELIDEAEKRVFEIRERGARNASAYLDMPALMTQVEHRIELLRKDPNALAGLSTGFADFDKKTTGLHPGDLVIIAGRPSMGKCLAADSELVADDGSLVTIEDLCRDRQSKVATLRDDWKLDRAAPQAYVDDGFKPVFEVTTRLGRRVETTFTHPFLTIEGWKPLGELEPGDYVAVPRVLPAFGNAPMRECELKLLAYLIGDGGLTGSSPRFTTTNPLIERDFIDAVAQFGGCVCTEYRDGVRAPSFAIVADADEVAANRAAFGARLDAAIAGSGRSARAIASEAQVLPSSVTSWRQGKAVPGREPFERLCRVLRVEPASLLADNGQARRNSPNPITTWLTKLGLGGAGAAIKHAPASVFRLPKSQLATFLQHLFATDGWACVYATGQSQIGYASISEKLARQVQHLLLRFGVVAKLRLKWVRYREARRPCWQVEISDPVSLATFISEIGIFAKEAAVARVRDAVAKRRQQTNTDLIPVGIWEHLRRAKGVLSWPEIARRAAMSDSNIHVDRRALSRARLARFAMALGDRNLADLAASDVYWDRIEAIIPTGVKQVYDLTMPNRNFVANDVCVHNTSFAMNIAEHAAIQEKKPVAVFSMEMSADQLATRVLSSFGRISQERLRSGQLDDNDWSRLVSASALIREAPLYIDETGALSPLDLRARARRMAARHDIKLIVVDYLQLMQVPGTNDNRTNEISEISRNLKSLAKELSVPIIALSQLNRAVEQRDNKRPRMADLRESGGIEQDADLVVFIYRDEVYNSESPDRGTAEIIIAKQRNGPLGMVKTAFLGHFTRFDNLAPEYYREEQLN
jgi:replicative DNA helicase